MTETRIAPGDPSLEAALRRELEGEVRFDALTRGIYSTDASHYQIEPLGVVFPHSTTDVQAVLQIARERGVPVLPRGGGTSQCGQTVGRAIVLDCSRHLTRVIDLDVAGEPWIEVEPGLVLDHLNAHLKPHGLWFPVDPSTGSRATIGGMAGNNSAGARSIRYGMMVDNVDSMEIVLPDGRCLRVGHGGAEEHGIPGELSALRALYERDAGEIRARKPRTMRNVAGYNLDRLDPARENVAQLLVGSEGTLAFFSRLRLRLRPLPRKRALGVCHFPDLVTALDSVQHLVDLAPSAIELVDQNVLRLAADVPDFRDAMRGFVRGTPGALLLVEFASTDPGAELGRDLRALRDRLMGSGRAGDVVFAETQQEQAAVWSVRKAGLNIVMSMAGPRKPLSFIEDCAVPLEHLAEYAQRVTEIFARHGTDGTWYAHASVGCLHVRPALNLKDPEDVARVRRIADETHEVVRAFGGTHSGEHGDGLLRSEFLETMLGARMAAAYAEVKRTFDPGGIMNPGKIVDPPRMDDRRLFRYHPEYGDARALPARLDWSDTGGMLGATERCNNNGACRKYEPDVMCPSFRVTHDERHSTRGRANALRLALSGQLGPDALTSREMGEAMSLCISCKACKRECPAGVDMARMNCSTRPHPFPVAAGWASRVSARFRGGRGERGETGRLDRTRRRAGARRSPSSWTRSHAGSSHKTLERPSACSRPAAGPSSPSRRPTVGARSAVAEPISARACSTKQGPKPAGSWRPSTRSSRAVRPWSDSSRRASTHSWTRCPTCCPVRSPVEWRLSHVRWRNSWTTRGRPGVRSPSTRAVGIEISWFTGTATRRRSVASPRSSRCCAAFRAPR
jgi:FAD/FMN-containing dehydrogenase